MTRTRIDQRTQLETGSGHVVNVEDRLLADLCASQVFPDRLLLVILIFLWFALASPVIVKGCHRWLRAWRLGLGLRLRGGAGRYEHEESGVRTTSLGQSAVFTPMLGPLGDLAANGPRDRHVFVTPSRSCVANGGGSGTELRRVRQAPLLPASRQQSVNPHGPACRADDGAWSGRLSAAGTWPGRPAFEFRSGWLVTYPISQFALHPRSGYQALSSDVPAGSTLESLCSNA